jgi:hypothetical protein
MLGTHVTAASASRRWGGGCAVGGTCGPVTGRAAAALFLRSSASPLLLLHTRHNTRAPFPPQLGHYAIDGYHSDHVAPAGAVWLSTTTRALLHLNTITHTAAPGPSATSSLNAPRACICAGGARASQPASPLCLLSMRSCGDACGSRAPPPLSSFDCRTHQGERCAADCHRCFRYTRFIDTRRPCAARLQPRPSFPHGPSSGGPPRGGSVGADTTTDAIALSRQPCAACPLDHRSPPRTSTRPTIAPPSNRHTASTSHNTPPRCAAVGRTRRQQRRPAAPAAAAACAHTGQHIKHTHHTHSQHAANPSLVVLARLLPPHGGLPSAAAPRSRAHAMAAGVCVAQPHLYRRLARALRAHTRALRAGAGWGRH